MSKKLILGGVALTLVLTLATCGDNETPDNATTVEPTSTTPYSSSVTTTNTSATSSITSTISELSPAPVAEPIKDTPLPVDNRPIGFLGAPGQEAPAPLDKVVQSCGDPAIHETGTTFFTDGSSGWTEQCAQEMMSTWQAPIQQFVVSPPPANNSPVQQEYVPQEDYVHPGSFCTGGSGVSKNGVPMTCAPGSDGRNRWQSAS
ncbi:Uncharacterised protein [Corynebacterium kutscheri]|uniref:Secreted protein n=1 Tax=Corynebacterium kutscheri TaxID=35755 RepID=A0A0F6TEX4_9CORY|nr:hypothetical protein [Corynebacterium kutscheri]AKE42186.1 hypothetical protein UL82_10260 [Corynebacterium kutscheri]VEH05805.1 Uncharacterised protein [Corynebacterium kutscheri]VEH10529.1 Uncharacterised protein [Corynebacterium kutscheri]VEH81697.1 Uncharacterised protein [Corynebacterium kutscheri]